jgi:hypothetical protein
MSTSMLMVFHIRIAVLTCVGAIEGARIEQYLLEKSRLARQVSFPVRAVRALLT